LPRTTPWLFFEYFVKPNYEEFTERPDDIRLGFNASVTAFHQADIFIAYYRKREPSRVAEWPYKKDFLKYLAAREPNFLTVQSVATAYKHLYPRGEFHEIGSPMALEGVMYQPGNVEIVRDWGASSHGEVVVRRRTKSQVSLKTALEGVVCKMWPSVLPKDWGDDQRP
jgi:hypothetical protein